MYFRGRRDNNDLNNTNEHSIQKTNDRTLIILSYESDLDIPNEYNNVIPEVHVLNMIKKSVRLDMS